MKNSKAARNQQVSAVQEKEIAKLLGGSVQSASGGTRFGGGDVHTAQFLIEAKTTTYARDRIQIHQDWLIKMRKQAFEQRKPYSALAVRFDPEGEDFFIVSSDLMRQLVRMVEHNPQDGTDV